MTNRDFTINKIRNQSKIKEGDVFQLNEGGSVTVIDYANSRSVLVRHNDKHAFEVRLAASRLYDGGIKNPFKPAVQGVGYFGVGPFKARVDGKITPEYSAWQCMLRRCYNVNSHNCYRNCSVDESWFCYQDFAKWYVSNEFYGLGYQLDKDILSKGSKIYSKDTCCLIPQELNTLLYDDAKNKGNYLTGVSYHGKSNKLQSRISINGAAVNLGLFDCEIEAHKAYVSAKENNVKETAIRLKSVIDKEVFDKLMNWTVS